MLHSSLDPVVGAADKSSRMLFCPIYGAVSDGALHTLLSLAKALLGRLGLPSSAVRSLADSSWLSGVPWVDYLASPAASVL